jgi:hypothetical protein
MTPRGHDEMSTATDTDPIRQELESYGPALAPGAAEQLARMLAPGLRGASAEVIAGAVARQLALPAIRKKFFDPEHKPAEGSPLRAALLRHKDRLAEGEKTVDALVRGWQVQIGNLPPDRLAAEVARRLGTRETGEKYLKDKPAASSAERRLAEILGRHFADLPASVRDAIARTRASLGHQPADHVVRSIAYLLARPETAALVGAEPLDPGDWRHGARRDQVQQPGREPSSRPSAERPRRNVF